MLGRDTSRYIWSTAWIVNSAVVWSAVTSAPSVTVDAPMRPEIGAVMRVYARLTRADSSDARSATTSASASRTAASASS